MEATTAMTPVRLSSEETVGPTTSMRRTSMFSPSAPLTLSLAAAWAFSSFSSLVGTCWATRISASLPNPTACTCTSPMPSLSSLVRRSPMSMAPALDCTSMRDPPLKSTP